MKRIRCTVAAVCPGSLAPNDRMLVQRTGCRTTKAANGASAPAPAATTATGSEAGASSKPIEVKVGLITPLSGDTKTYGESVKNAVELAIEKPTRPVKSTSLW